MCIVRITVLIYGESSDVNPSMHNILRDLEFVFTPINIEINVSQLYRR